MKRSLAYFLLVGVLGIGLHAKQGRNILIQSDAASAKIDSRELTAAFKVAFVDPGLISGVKRSSSVCFGGYTDLKTQTKNGELQFEFRLSLSDPGPGVIQCKALARRSPDAQSTDVRIQTCTFDAAPMQTGVVAEKWLKNVHKMTSLGESRICRNEPKQRPKSSSESPKGH